jgi:hypothetical protein
MAWASERITRDAGKLSRRVDALINLAAYRAGLNFEDVYVVQGSWSSGSASAGTHSGGGAFDLRVWNLPSSKHDDLVYQLRKLCGGPVWLRDKAHGGFDPHIHGIVRDEPGLSDAARHQVWAYDRNLDGLAGDDGRDYHPRPAWTRFPFDPEAIEMPLTSADKAWISAEIAKQVVNASVPSPSATFNKWALGHLVEWQTRMLHGTVGPALVALASGQQLAQADIDALQAKLDEVDAEIEEHSAPKA